MPKHSEPIAFFYLARIQAAVEGDTLLCCVSTCPAHRRDEVPIHNARQRQSTFVLDAAQRLGMPVSPELPPLEVFKRLVLEGEGLAVVRVDLGEPVLAYWASSLPVGQRSPAPKADAQDRPVECTLTP